MKKIYFPNEKIDNNKSKIAVLGKFEAMHKGHIFLLNKARKKADIDNKELIVMFFSEREKNNFYSLEERLMFVNNFNIDYALIFEPNSKNFSYKYFEFENYLKKLGVTDVFVGHDFVYGNNKEGNIEKLKLKFNVEAINEQGENNLKYRTSNLLNVLKNDDLKSYKKIMNHYFFYKGPVVRGLGNGKKFGMPTANVDYPKYKIDVNDGVYFSYVIYEGKRLPSLTSISYNPTLNAKIKTYETYIYNFDKEIYGKEIYVELIKKYRDPIKFNSIDDLINKLKEDKKLGIKFFQLR